MTAKIARQFTWISVERYAGEVLEVPEQGLRLLGGEEIEAGHRASTGSELVLQHLLGKLGPGRRPFALLLLELGGGCLDQRRQRQDLRRHAAAGGTVAGTAGEAEEIRAADLETVAQPAAVLRRCCGELGVLLLRPERTDPAEGRLVEVSAELVEPRRTGRGGRRRDLGGAGGHAQGEGCEEEEQGGTQGAESGDGAHGQNLTCPVRAGDRPGAGRRGLTARRWRGRDGG